MSTNATRLARICEFAQDAGIIDGWASEYAEPGYTTPESKTILFGDWNPSCGYSSTKAEQARDIRPRFAALAERLGAELEWSDEWYTCECSKAVRSQPDSYSWLRSYVYTEGEIMCRECALDDAASYVDDFLLNDSSVADTFDVDLLALGFHCVDAGQSGLHPGQNDTPEQMVAKCPTGFDYVFALDSAGQFDVGFSMWIRPQSEDPV